ncbi:MAG: serine protease [Cyanobacteria bacterium P01_B01_bin.77]
MALRTQSSCSGDQRPKVLILEDNKYILEKHRKALEKKGFLCYPTQYADQAITLMEQDKSIGFALIDVILHDPQDISFSQNHNETTGFDCINEPELQARTGDGVVREVNSKRHDVNFVFITYLPELESIRNNNQFHVFKAVEERLMRNRGVVDVIHRYQINTNPSEVYERVSSRIWERYTSSYVSIVHGNTVANCSKSVCQVQISPRFQYTEDIVDLMEYGTGWLIAPDIVLTCWHLFDQSYQQGRNWPSTNLNLNETIASSQAIFEYLTPGQGIKYKFSEILAWDSQLDYVFLRIRDRIHHSLRKREFLRLELQQPTQGEPELFIIHHPKDWVQHSSSGWYVKLSDNLEKVLYKVSTERGTSGAPVIRSDNAKVIAIHASFNHACGLQEGIMLQKIMEDLKQKKPEIYREIMIYQ